MVTKTFMINGGAGRVLTALPALEKYAKLHPDEDFRVVVHGFESFFFGSKALTKRTFSANQKGLFDEIKDSVIIQPEPYYNNNYINQRISLAEAFDEIINGTEDHSDLLKPNLNLTSPERNMARQVVGDVKNQQKKNKTVVIQPFGSSFKVDQSMPEGMDESSRSLTAKNYLYLVGKLAKKYNMIYMGEVQLDQDQSCFKPRIDQRGWAGVIELADYFIGVDSLGQHLAYSVGTPSSVILGSTFAVNISYPNTHNIIEKEGFEKEYSPIRLAQFDSHLADRLNDGVIDFSERELDDIFTNIVKDISDKT